MFLLNLILLEVLVVLTKQLLKLKMTSSSLANIRQAASQTTDALACIVYPTLPTDYRVVKGLVNRRPKKGAVEFYKVRWRGAGKEEDSWVGAELVSAA
jgi:hypothetical protein